MSGQLPLMPAIKQLMEEVFSGPGAEEGSGLLSEERKLITAAKKIGLFAAGVATQKYMQGIQDQQEIMGAIANMTIETYALESAVYAHKNWPNETETRMSQMPLRWPGSISPGQWTELKARPEW